MPPFLEFCVGRSHATSLLASCANLFGGNLWYTGQQDEAGGVMAMLELILSDFSNLEADTKAQEAAAQKASKIF